MNKRLLGLVVGAAAMALTQMTPAQAAGGGGTLSYAGGGTAFGTGLIITPGNGAPGIGGVTFNGVSGTTAHIKIADASGRPQAAHVSFRAPQTDPTKPFAQVGSFYVCGTAVAKPFPALATRVVVFIEAASTDNAAVTPGDCATGKYGPPTTGTVTLTMT